MSLHSRDQKSSSSWVCDDTAYTNTPGQPARTRPLLSHRTPSKTRVQTELPTTPAGSPSGRKGTLPNPRFSQKTGPKLLGRLAHNSVLPREKGLREAIAAAKKAARRPPTAGPSAEGLTLEERAIQGLDFSRWDDPGYELRQDEYWVVLDILNNSQVARAAGFIYLFTQPELARAIEACDHIQAALPDQVGLQYLRETYALTGAGVAATTRSRPSRGAHRIARERRRDACRLCAFGASALDAPCARAEMCPE